MTPAPALVEGVLSYLYGQTLWESQSERAKRSARDDVGAVLMAAIAQGWRPPMLNLRPGVEYVRGGTVDAFDLPYEEEY